MYFIVGEYVQFETFLKIFFLFYVIKENEQLTKA